MCLVRVGLEKGPDTIKEYSPFSRSVFCFCNLSFISHFHGKAANPKHIFFLIFHFHVAHRFAVNAPLCRYYVLLFHYISVSLVA